MCLAQPNKKGELKALKENSKTHATLKSKIFTPLYAEDLQFLTTRMGWSVTKIYEHYTFKQETFKKEFVVKNQNARKQATSKVEKDFYKLLNNSNFGNDCRNNVGNCNLELLYDGAEEVKYIKKYSNLFTDYKLREFFTESALRQQVKNESKEKLEEFDPNDEFYDSYEGNMFELEQEKLEAIDGFMAHRKKRKRDQGCFAKKVDTIENEIEASEDLRKNKMLIEFNDSQCSAVKQIAVKTQTTVKYTTRFLAGNMLMFAFH